MSENLIQASSGTLGPTGSRRHTWPAPHGSTPPGSARLGAAW